MFTIWTPLPVVVEPPTVLFVMVAALLISISGHDLPGHRGIEDESSRGATI